MTFFKLLLKTNSYLDKVCYIRERKVGFEDLRFIQRKIPHLTLEQISEICKDTIEGVSFDYLIFYLKFHEAEKLNEEFRLFQNSVFVELFLKKNELNKFFELTIVQGESFPIELVWKLNRTEVCEFIYKKLKKKYEKKRIIHSGKIL